MPNPHLTEWDYRWIQLADSIKEWSKDSYKRVGCVLVRENRIVSTGYNGFPSGISDTEIRLNDKSFKNEVIIHAEKNAIAWAAKEGVSTEGSSAFITFHPCSPCASVLIGAGIKRVVCPNLNSYQGSWKESLVIASDILYEAGVPVFYYDPLRPITNRHQPP
jgi:dCMP deaminase